jgi:hypothetical protein
MVLFLILAGVVAGCSNPQRESAAQVAVGGRIYARDCATELCHGNQGEGIRAGDSFRVWPLVGVEFEARNPNAQVIFDVVRSGSEPNLRALSDEEIYAAIAYELAQNGVQLSEPLGDENAASIASGETNPKASWGSLYPPPGNAILLEPPAAPEGVLQGAERPLSLRVDQLAKASVIGKAVAPEGGYFVIVVFALQNLGEADLSVDPQFLHLLDNQGQAHSAAQANLAYPMERFHAQMIQPGHGTAGYDIFAVPPGAAHERLVYDDPTAEALEIDLR